MPPGVIRIQRLKLLRGGGFYAIFHYLSYNYCIYSANFYLKTYGISTQIVKLVNIEVFLISLSNPTN
jgi:hypothetical protein